MVWSPELSRSLEVRKCRHRVVSFLTGHGLDLGCGTEKICETAIGIDIVKTPAVDICLDLSASDALSIFSDCSMDYVFSSHCLEDFVATAGTIKEWWRLVKPSGYLILYGPDPNFYPRIGTAGANVEHEHDLYWQQVWNIIKNFGNAKLIHASRHNESNEYSWLLIVQKRFDFLDRPFIFNWSINDFLRRNGDDKLAFPLKRDPEINKSCLFVRYGAYGDVLWSTPALRLLKREGWYIVYNCTEYSAQVLRQNPHIDQFLVQGKGVIPDDDVKDYLSEIGKSFDKTIHLSGSVEGSLLKIEGTPEFNWPHGKRHRECNVNYMDRTMELAGFPKAKSMLPELYFTDLEEELAKIFMSYYKDKFTILWSLSGSSIHKTYPWSAYAASYMLEKHDDVIIFTVGDELCKKIEWPHPRTVNKSGVWNIRDSMIMTKYVNLVIGPETGILNAASCFETPKIILLSHSSVENLTKYWHNCTNLTPHSCSCYPCHRLIYSNPCPKEIMKLPDPETGMLMDMKVVRCVHNISPERVYDAFLKYYRNWKDKRNAKFR